MERRTVLRLTVAVTLASVLAACAGSSSTTTDRDAFVSDAVDQMETTTWLTPAEARCLVSGQVDVLGYDDLVAAGVTAEEIAGARIHALSDTLTGSQRSAMIRTVPACGIEWPTWFSRGAATAGERACADNLATQDQLTDVYASVVAADPAPVREAALVAAYVGCFED